MISLETAGGYLLGALGIYITWRLGHQAELAQKKEVERLKADLQAHIELSMQPVRDKTLRSNEFEAKIISANEKKLREAIERTSQLNMTGLPLEKFAIGDLPWRNYFERAIVISIVSGKGGVGKSMVAAALADNLAKSDRVLLVDFDLHNRGLTCRHQPGLDVGSDSLMKWIGRFLEVKSNNPVPDMLARQEFVEMRRRFLYEDLSTEKHFNSKVSGLGDNFNSNLSFLPSRPPETPFLASKESELHAVDVATLIQIIARAAQDRGYGQYVVIDCHGGQDMYMAGAVVASDVVITVVKPEIGGLEGAKELVAVSKKLVTEDRYTPVASALIINECQPGTETLVNDISAALSNEKDEVFKVERNDNLSLPAFEPTSESIKSAPGLDQAINSLATIIRSIRRKSAEFPIVKVPAPAENRPVADLYTRSGSNVIEKAIKRFNDPATLRHGDPIDLSNFFPYQSERGSIAGLWEFVETVEFHHMSVRLIFIAIGTKLDLEHLGFFDGAQVGLTVKQCVRPATVDKHGKVLGKGKAVT